MKKSISILLGLMLMFSLSLNLYSQSTEEKLEQLELLKQFIGTWQAETGEDSTVVITYEALGDGIIITQENIADGVIYRKVKAIMGVSSDKKTIMVSGMTEDGEVGFQYGKFVTKDKLVIEFYLDNVKHPMNIQEFEFQSPDEFNARGKYRGEKMTWDVEWWDSVTFHKIK